MVFWVGEGLSLYGTQIANLALPLTAVLVFQVGPEELGLLRFAQLVPFLALALVFGVWVDRVRKRPVMLWANVVRMVLIGLVPLLYYAELLTLPMLYALAFGVGTAAVLFDVSWMSYVPVLVKDKRSLLEANTKLNATLSSADVAGPGIAGTLVTAFSAPAAMAANAFSYALSVISLLLVRAPEPDPPARTEKRRLRAELAEGLRWVFGNRWLRAIGLVGCSCNFFLTMVQSLFLLYAVRDKELSAATIGFVMGAAAVGGLLGALISGMVVRRLSVGTAYRVSVSIIFLGPLLIPAAGGPSRWRAARSWARRRVRSRVETSRVTMSRAMPRAQSQYRSGASTKSETSQGTAPDPNWASGQSTTMLPRRQTRPACQRSAT